MSAVSLSDRRPARPEARGARAPVLEIRDLAKRYGEGPLVVDGVSLSLRPGELVALLGANGSGKSTVLRCAVRLTDPTAGSIHVGGRDLATLSGLALREARRSVGMVFQHAHLVRRRSALANAASGALGRHRGVRVAAGRLPDEALRIGLECLGRVGLAEHRWQRAGRLSGGQAQRAAIARALCQRPSVLLADEPVASLDPEAAEAVMELLVDLTRSEQLGVLCVLHQPELALRYADRVLGLRAGRLQFDRMPAELDDGALQELYA